MIRYLALFGLSLGLLGAPASGQSLGEVAKKEKARRDTIKTPTKTIDDEALKNASGEGLSVTGVEVDPQDRSEPAAAPSGSASAAGGGGDTGRNLTAQEVADRREAHRREWESKVLDAEEALAALKQSARDCDYAQARPKTYMTVGCEGIDDRVKQAERYLKHLKSQRYNWEKR